MARQQHPRRGGQLDRAIEPAEQLHPEILLQRMDLVADRGRGDAELLGCLAEAFQPGGRLKGSQSAERRQVAASILADYASAYGMRSVSLRYFNAVGAAPEAEIGEAHRHETHLVPLVLDVVVI